MGNVAILAPFQDVPVRFDGIQILDGRGRPVATIFFASPSCSAKARPLMERTAAGQRFVDGADEFDQNLAFAAHDNVDPGLGQHLLVHEGGMDAADHRDRVRVKLLGDLQRAFGLVDRGVIDVAPMMSGFSRASISRRASSDRSLVIASMNLMSPKPAFRSAPAR